MKKDFVSQVIERIGSPRPEGGCLGALEERGGVLRSREGAAAGSTWCGVVLERGVAAVYGAKGTERSVLFADLPSRAVAASD